MDIIIVMVRHEVLFRITAGWTDINQPVTQTIIAHIQIARFHTGAKLLQKQIDIMVSLQLLPRLEVLEYQYCLG